MIVFTDHEKLIDSVEHSAVFNIISAEYENYRKVIGNIYMITVQ